MPEKQGRIISVAEDNAPSGVFTVTYTLPRTGTAILYATIHAVDELDAYKQMQQWLRWRGTT